MTPQEEESVTQTAVRERPILFSGEMVRAILDGRKTQTRRVAKLTDSGRVRLPGKPTNWHPDDPNAVRACPFGQPGDRLWVRETFTDRFTDNADGERWVAYQADGRMINHSTGDRDANVGPLTMRSPIHMPRWASRLTLEVTEVRVQRVQEISEEDAQAEGVGEGIDLTAAVLGRAQTPCRSGFHAVWDSLNAKRGHGWDANPFVWTISFRRRA